MWVYSSIWWKYKHRETEGFFSLVQTIIQSLLSNKQQFHLSGLKTTQFHKQGLKIVLTAKWPSRFANNFPTKSMLFKSYFNILQKLHS